MEATTVGTGAASASASVGMMRLWRTLQDYILWSYERGTIQYDVMVTLILFFVFLSPQWINYKDKPLPHDPHRTEVVVDSDGKAGLIFQIDGSLVRGKQDNEIRSDLLKIIEPISGQVSITKYDVDRDRFGGIKRYQVWCTRSSANQ